MHSVMVLWGQGEDLETHELGTQLPCLENQLGLDFRNNENFAKEAVFKAGLIAQLTWFLAKKSFGQRCY